MRINVSTHSEWVTNFLASLSAAAGVGGVVDLPLTLENFVAPYFIPCGTCGCMVTSLKIWERWCTAFGFVSVAGPLELRPSQLGYYAKFGRSR